MLKIRLMELGKVRETTKQDEINITKELELYVGKADCVKLGKGFKEYCKNKH